MKWVLYVIISVLVVVRTKQTENYNLLPFNLIQKYSNVVPSTDISAPGGKFLKLSGINSEIRVPLSELAFGGKNIKSPYLLHMKFKIERPVRSTLFSIKDNSTARMIVEITADESETTLRIQNEFNYLYVRTTFNIVGSWTDLLLRVNTENITLFNKCKEVGYSPVEAGAHIEVEFANDAFLVFGSTEFEAFDGAIAEIKLYPHADEISLKSLCNEDSMLTSDSVNEDNNSIAFEATTSTPATLNNINAFSEVLNIPNVPNLDNEYNFFPVEQLSEYSNLEPTIDESVLEDMFLNFTGIQTKIPVTKLGFSSGQNISEPYAIRMNFKLLEKVNQSSMFAIEDNSNVWMMVQFTTLNNRTIITLKVPGTKDINFIDDDNIVGKKVIYLIQVNNGIITLFNNCTELQKISAPNMKNIKLSNDMFLVLGNDKYSSNDFKGSINELKFYPNNEKASEMFCNDNNIYENFPLVKYEKGEKGDKGDQGEKGIIGAKGEKGDTGLKGEPGISIKGDAGPRGLPGQNGSPGEEGKCQCSESVISNMLKTMPEMRGPAGEPGPQGVEGPSGLNGSMGIQGPQGERGFQGLRGVTGETGANGTAGRDGEPGFKGEPGKDGPQGPPGPQGIAGPAGPTGPAYVLSEEDKKEMKGIPGENGNQGLQGLQGPIGPKGEKGESGETGKQGLIGEQGVKGPKGEKGQKGDVGDTGKAGNDGLPGTAGNDGRNGMTGDNGEKGDTGSQGPAGAPGSLTELLDSSLNPLEYAQIVEKLRGVKGNNGTDGQKGSKGEMGLLGMSGTPGKDGQEGKEGPRGPQGLKGDIGPTGSKGAKGEPGNPGPPGQVPASIIASLKGTKGETGIQGPTGNRGPNGYTGKAGATGKVGPKGVRGDKGAAGPVGPVGLSGYNGTVGEKGQKGECAVSFDYNKLRGDKGDRGVPGKQGQPGSQGLAGICPECNKVEIVGPPGLPGPRGPPGVSLVGPKGEPGYVIFNDPPATKADKDVHPATVIISSTIHDLIKRTSEIPLGTLAYVPRENTLLIRGEREWQYVKMESLSFLDRPTSTSSTPLTLRPQQSTELPKNPNKSRQYIRIAALNDPYNGKIKKSHEDRQRNADLLCFKQSKMYGGDFQAFSTHRGDSMKNIIHEDYRHLPVRNLREDLLFFSWDSIFDGTGGKFNSKVKIYSFNGKDVMQHPHWPIKMVWHGSNAFGSRHSFTCSNWQSESSSEYGIASSLLHRQLLGQKLVSCDKELIILCVGISH